MAMKCRSKAAEKVAIGDEDHGETTHEGEGSEDRSTNPGNAGLCLSPSSTTEEGQVARDEREDARGEKGKETGSECDRDRQEDRSLADGGGCGGEKHEVRRRVVTMTPCTGAYRLGWGSIRSEASAE